MILDTIVEAKKQEVKALKARLAGKHIETAVTGLPPALDFAGALKAGKRRISLLAEVKKASPSKGIIRADFNPVEIASSYEQAGADAISVLTDKQFFQGSGDYLAQIRESVRIPLLRKDFIIDELQIYESRLLGADAILLIAGILTKEQLRSYRELAEQLGMDALVEAHDLPELEKAVAAGAGLLGINNRNLQTFEVSLSTTASLAKEVPKDVFLVSESGIFTFDDVEYVRRAGAGAILVGESLMRQPDVGQAVQLLFEGSAVS